MRNAQKDRIESVTFTEPGTGEEYGHHPAVEGWEGDDGYYHIRTYGWGHEAGEEARIVVGNVDEREGDHVVLDAVYVTDLDGNLS